MSRLVVAPAGAGDMAAVLALNDVVQRLHAERRPDLYRLDADPDGRHAILENARTDARWRLWVAHAAGTVAGYLSTELIERVGTALKRAHTEGHLHHLCVDPAWRRQGIGTRLVAQATADLRAAGADRITVAYWLFNDPARRTFEAAGFRPATVVAELAPVGDT